VDGAGREGKPDQRPAQPPLPPPVVAAPGNETGGAGPGGGKTEYDITNKVWRRAGGGQREKRAESEQGSDGYLQGPLVAAAISTLTPWCNDHA